MYVQHKPYVSAFWTDEAGQVIIPDYLNIVARYRFDHFLLGDPKQSKPVVVSPSPLSSFMQQLKTSPFKVLSDAQWPAVTLALNRRSVQGIIDVPSELFYESQVTAHPICRCCKQVHLDHTFGQGDF